MAIDSKELSQEQKVFANTLYISDAFRCVPHGSPVPFRLLMHPTTLRGAGAKQFPQDQPHIPNPFTEMISSPMTNILYFSAAKSIKAASGSKLSESTHVVGLSSEGEELARLLTQLNPDLTQIQFHYPNDPNFRSRLQIGSPLEKDAKVLAVETYIVNPNLTAERLNILFDHQGNHPNLQTELVLAVEYPRSKIAKLKKLIPGLNICYSLTQTQLLEYYLQGKRLPEETKQRFRQYLQELDR